ncbi:MAG: hypothetical protein PUD93_01400 [Lachnospiraceae bacterium]|nr:hypothetical protein [Lachnospiraceae bacterium]
MEERLKKYLAEMENQAVLWEKGNGTGLTEQEKEWQKKELLTQIEFFQHERLVHLIVTVTFAVLTMLAIVGVLLTPQPALFALILLLLILLIPYIRHYYILENGVQKLYGYYDRLVYSFKKDKNLPTVSTLVEESGMPRTTSEG